MSRDIHEIYRIIEGWKDHYITVQPRYYENVSPDVRREALSQLFGVLKKKGFTAEEVRLKPIIDKIVEYTLPDKEHKRISLKSRLNWAKMVRSEIARLLVYYFPTQQQEEFKNEAEKLDSSIPNVFTEPTSKEKEQTDYVRESLTKEDKDLQLSALIDKNIVISTEFDQDLEEALGIREEFRVRKQ